MTLWIFMRYIVLFKIFFLFCLRLFSDVMILIGVFILFNYMNNDDNVYGMK